VLTKATFTPVPYPSEEVGKRNLLIIKQADVKFTSGWLILYYGAPHVFSSDFIAMKEY
jgi:hypothetical protein